MVNNFNAFINNFLSDCLIEIQFKNTKTIDIEKSLNNDIYKFFISACLLLGSFFYYQSKNDELKAENTHKTIIYPVQK